MHRIKILGQLFKFIFWFGFWITPVVLIFCWLSSGALLDWFHFQIHSFSNLPSINSLSSTARLLGFLVTLIPAGILMLVFYFTAKLFASYQSGKIFEIDNALCIRNIGITIFAWELISPIYDLLISYVFSYSTGVPIFQVAFNAQTIGNIVVAILLIVIGWIMLEANKLKEEQEYTI